MNRKNLLKKTISVLVAAGLVLFAAPVFASGTTEYSPQPNMPGQQNNMFGQMQFNRNVFGTQQQGVQQNVVPSNYGQSNNTTGTNMQLNGMWPNQTNISSNYLKLIAEKLEIDTSDLSNSEIAAAIIEQLDELTDEELDILAKAFFISTDNMEENAIINAIETKIDDLLLYDYDDTTITVTLEKIAAVLDIDNDGLTDSEAVEAIKDGLEDASLEKIIHICSMLRINISGMTYSEIIDKLEEALEELG